MHILLTGAAGLIGSHTLTYLISEGHSVAATDIVPLPAHVLPLPAPSTFIQLDLTDFIPLETFLRSSQPQCEAIIHLGAIPNPLSLDWRTVHNVNVTSNYNILMTAVMLGIKRIVQASSVNAAGLSYTPDDHRMFDTLPMDEMTPMRPEDAYALSKQQCESQATSICQLERTTRIASLRFHMARPSYQLAWLDSRPEDLWGWVSLISCAEACLLGITSAGWSGHEVFNIVAPEVCWEGDVKTKAEAVPVGGDGRDVFFTPELMKEIPEATKPSSMELLAGWWPDTRVKDDWWTDGTERRGFWDCRKANRMLGWSHKG